MNCSVKAWLTIVLFTVFALVGRAQNEATAGAEVLYPIKLKGKWTFVSDVDSSKVFPIFDSIVVSDDPYYFGGAFVVRGANLKWGLISSMRTTDLLAKLDTIIKLECDSIFDSRFGVFLKKDGLWSAFSGAESTSKFPPTKVDDWFLDEDFLYYFVDGKTGLFGEKLHFPPTYAFIRPFTNEEGLFLVTDGKLFGLIKSDGKELIPVCAETIQWASQGFIRYWQGGSWKYVNASTGKTIDPKGCDFVPYSGYEWKIYSRDRKRSTLYLFDGEKEAQLSGDFHDYFVLDKDRIAVRKDSLIGVIHRDGKVIFSPRFDQIKFLNKSRYAGLEKGRWYLVDAEGNKLSKGYDYITESRSNGTFTVHLGYGIGELYNSGKEKVTPIYKGVVPLQNYYVLIKGDRMALADTTGKAITGFIYQNYRLDGDYVVMYEGPGRMVLFSKAGRLNNKPCDLYLAGDLAVKCYSLKDMEMIVLDERLAVIERQPYPGIRSVELEGLPDQKMPPFHVNAENQTELEEHQLTGYFGYRNRWTAVLKDKPHYVEVETNVDFGYQNGVKQFDPKKMLASDGVNYLSYFEMQTFETGGGTYVNDPFVCALMNVDFTGTSTASNRMWTKDLSHWGWWQLPVGDKPGVGPVYANYREANIVYYNERGALQPAGQEPGSFSRYDYWNTMNSGNNLGLAASDISKVMDPRNRLKVAGGIWTVIQESVLDVKPPFNPALFNRTFAHIGFTHGDKLGYYTSGGVIDYGHCEWADVRSDSLEITHDYRAVIPVDDAIFKVVGVESRRAVVHPYHPDFLFIDRSKEDGEYYANGRLLHQGNEKCTMTSVDGDTIFEVDGGIYYLGARRFMAIRNQQLTESMFVNSFSPGSVIRPYDVDGRVSGDLQLIDRDGKVLAEFAKTKLVQYHGGAAALKNREGYTLIDTMGKFLMPYSKTEPEHKENGIYLVKLNEKRCLYDVPSAKADTLFDFEEYVCDGWVKGKDGKKEYMRKLFSQKRINVTNTTAVFGNILTIKEKKSTNVVNEQGERIFPRLAGIGKTVVGKEIMGFQGRKEWYFTDRKGTVIYKAPTTRKIWVDNGHLIYESNDNWFRITLQGTVEKYPKPKKGEKAKPVTPDYTIFELDGSEGVVSSRGDTLVAPKFAKIRGRDGEEFLVDMPIGVGLANEKRKLVVDCLYDEIIVLGPDICLVRIGYQYGLIRRNGTWLKPMD